MHCDTIHKIWKNSVAGDKKNLDNDDYMLTTVCMPPGVPVATVGINNGKNAAVLAGEMSGHTFFKDRYYGFDDAVYAGCRIIEIISRWYITNT